MISSSTTMIILAFCFSCLMWQESWATNRNSRSITDVLKKVGNPSLLLSKLLFALTIFLFAVLTYNVNAEIFSLQWNQGWRLVIPLLVLCAFLTGFWMAGKDQQRQSITQCPVWSFGIRYILVRTVHLIFYEFFFRGVLLFTLIKCIGVIPAVWLVMVLYALHHFHCEYSEMMGTIPFGLLLCALTLIYQSVWPAVAVHLALALSHECRLLIHSSSPSKFLKL